MSNEDDATLPDTPREHIPTAERIDEAADGMEAFNRILWQLAKSMWILMLMLLGIVVMILAYYLVEFVAAL